LNPSPADKLDSVSRGEAATRDAHPDTEPVRYFQAVHDAFSATARGSERVERHYAMAAETICLRFAGAALERCLTPTLAHLLTPPTPRPSLTVCVWDSASTGTAMPPPPWKPDDQLAQGEIRGYNTQRIRTAFDAGSVSLSIMDMELNLGVFWIRNWRDLPYWERGAPLRAILHWWMGSRAYSVVHGAAVGTPSEGVLLVGKSGSGKSTTALACLDAGLAYAGDDYCLLSTRGSPYIHSMYSSAKLDHGTERRFPRLYAAVSNPDRPASEKALYFLHRHCPRQIVRGFALRAILIPRITGRHETRLVAASMATVLLNLAPSSLFQLPGRTAATFAAMAEVVRRVPCYALELGTDLSVIPQVIAGILTGDQHAAR
jgi:hypothetical protein